jgi:protein phosphatase PTC2/3
VTPFPDVISLNRDRDDQFMVVACDGIWDCVSNEECALRMAEKIERFNCFQ